MVQFIHYFKYYNYQMSTKGPEDTTSEEHVPDSIVTFQKQDDSKSSTETSTEDSSSLLQPSPPKRTNQTSQKLKRWSKMIKHTFPSKVRKTTSYIYYNIYQTYFGILYISYKNYN